MGLLISWEIVIINLALTSSIRFFFNSEMFDVISSNVISLYVLFLVPFISSSASSPTPRRAKFASLFEGDKVTVIREAEGGLTGKDEEEEVIGREFKDVEFPPFASGKNRAFLTPVRGLERTKEGSFCDEEEEGSTSILILSLKGKMLGQKTSDV